MGFVDGPVTVQVPATSANLGPGYDCLGLAWDLTDRLTARVTGSGLRVTVTGEGSGEVPHDERHLVVHAMRETFTALGEEPGGLDLTCENRIWHGRGLGSSSAAIVAGIVLARALVAGGPERLGDREALALATRIEGHPDNVAPALLGGLVVCGRSAEEVWAHRLSVDPRVQGMAYVPPDPVSTEVARGLLPTTVPHAEAAANTARAAVLVAALAGSPELLWLGTEDVLHQHHRRAAMPATIALIERLRADGIPAFVSGAGPTVVTLRVGDAESPSAVELAGRCPPGWIAQELVVGLHGARVVAPTR